MLTPPSFKENMMVTLAYAKSDVDVSKLRVTKLVGFRHALSVEISVTCVTINMFPFSSEWKNISKNVREAFFLSEQLLIHSVLPALSLICFRFPLDENNFIKNARKPFFFEWKSSLTQFGITCFITNMFPFFPEWKIFQKIERIFWARNQFGEKTMLSGTIFRSYWSYILFM